MNIEDSRKNPKKSRRSFKIKGSMEVLKEAQSRAKDKDFKDKDVLVRATQTTGRNP